MWMWLHLRSLLLYAYLLLAVGHRHLLCPPLGPRPVFTCRPLEMLRSTGMYAVRTAAWLSHTHYIPNLTTNPAGGPFFPGSKLTGTFLLNPMEPDEFTTIHVRDCTVNLFMAIPLTTAEAAWRRKVGADNSIFYIFGDKSYGDHIHIWNVIEPSRPCTVDDLHCDVEIARQLAERDAALAAREEQQDAELQAAFDDE